MQRANIKEGPPTPPSLARPRNTRSSPPFFTTLPTASPSSPTPSLFFPTLLFLLRYFPSLSAAPPSRSRREGRREGERERERNKAKTVYQGCKSKRECPQTAFIFSRFSSRFTKGRRLDHGRRTRDIITFNYRFCLDV